MGLMNFFWFRRDLRLEDNAGLFHALREGGRVLPVFIFDTDILGKLVDKDDRRVQFIYETVSDLKEELQKNGSDLIVRHGKPREIWRELMQEYKPVGVDTNTD